MADTISTHAAEQWIPVSHFNPRTKTWSFWCRDNTQANAAVDVAKERGWTPRRFKAAADAPAPILITARDERPTMAELLGGCR